MVVYVVLWFKIPETSCGISSYVLIMNYETSYIGYDLKSLKMIVRPKVFEEINSSNELKWNPWPRQWKYQRRSSQLFPTRISTNVRDWLGFDGWLYLKSFMQSHADELITHTWKLMMKRLHKGVFTSYLLEYVCSLTPNGLTTQPSDGIKLIID